MSISDLNRNLRALYRQHWTTMLGLRKNYRLSDPLCMNLKACYLKQKPRLFIVGQQTQEWDYTPNLTVGDAVENYRNFDFTLGYPSIRGTPFWSVVRRLEELLCIPEDCVAWSELVRMDGRPGAPSPPVREEIVKKLPTLLRQEIRYSRPHIVVFFTGPNDDYLLNQTFGVTDEDYCQVSASFEERELAKVGIRIDHLHPSAYRTYHPHMLQRQGGPRRDLILRKIITHYRRYG